jgi:thymidylate synthase ThyX
MSMLISAEELINISRLRLCTCASKETREVWQAVKEKVAEVDPDLAPFMVRTCVFRGGICPELKSCGYINTGAGQNELNEYKKLFK